MPLRLRTTEPRLPPLAAVSRRLLSMGTPSTTISGSLFPEIEAMPRRTIFEVPAQNGRRRDHQSGHLAGQAADDVGVAVLGQLVPVDALHRIAQAALRRAVMPSAVTTPRFLKLKELPLASWKSATAAASELIVTCAV